MNSIKVAFSKLIEFISTHKTPIIAMASIVVCITTYSLILPALTLTIEKAQEQGHFEDMIRRAVEGTEVKTFRVVR